MRLQLKKQGGTTPPIAGSLLPLACALLVIGQGLLTGIAYARSQQRIATETQTNLEETTSSHVHELLHHMETYGDILYATRGLFAATEMDVDTWNSFVRAQSAPNRYAGMQAIGYAEIVPSEQLQTYERTLQTSQSPNVAIHPSHNTDKHVILTYHEGITLPGAGTLNALGFDLASSPERLAALEKARATGKMSATTGITLTATGKEGFLLILPLTQKFGQRTSGSSTFGYGVASFDFSGLIEATIGSRLDKFKTSIYIEDITDGTSSIPLLNRQSVQFTPMASRAQTLQVADRTWKITLQMPRDELLTSAQHFAPFAILAIGMGFMTATSILAYALRLRRQLKMSR